VRRASAGEETSPGAPDSGEGSAAQGEGARRPGASAVLAAVLGAAALGGLAAWLYLHHHATAESRASHRIEELQTQLDSLSRQLADYSDRGRRPEGGPA